jgi:hypothetical protein
MSKIANFSLAPLSARVKDRYLNIMMHLMSILKKDESVLVPQITGISIVELKFLQNFIPSILAVLHNRIRARKYKSKKSLTFSTPEMSMASSLSVHIRRVRRAEEADEAGDPLRGEEAATEAERGVLGVPKL